MIADMLSSYKGNLIKTELFIGRKNINVNMFLVFITQSYSAVPKKIRLNYAHYFLMKIPNKQVLHQVTFNHSSDIDVMNFYKKSTSKPYFF